MPLARRALLTAFAGLAPTPRSISARLLPGVDGVIGLVPLPPDRVALRADCVAGQIDAPAGRARIAAVLPLADRDVAMLGIAADPPSGGQLDLMAIVGWDGSALRLLALEVLSWQAPGGARLATRVAAVGDRSRLRLARDAAAPRNGGSWRHESWIDLLAWHDGGALADAPPRPPLPGTWQAHLAQSRAGVIARLGMACQSVSDELLALCGPPDIAAG
jgi:hypothetical protein